MVVIIAKWRHLQNNTANIARAVSCYNKRNGKQYKQPPLHRYVVPRLPYIIYDYKNRQKRITLQNLLCGSLLSAKSYRGANANIPTIMTNGNIMSSALCTYFTSRYIIPIPNPSMNAITTQVIKLINKGELKSF